MALLEEQFTEKLETGAPDITYEGEEGREQQIAQALWDKLPPQARMQFGSFSQFFNSGAWKKVLAALQQQMQGGQEEIQETETETIGRAPQEGLSALMPGARPMAGGGIMGSNAGSMLVAPTADGSRPEYGFLSKIKDVGKKIVGGVKKVVKSPIGKAAALYGLGTLAGGMPAFGGAGGSFMSRLASPGNLLNLVKPSGWSQGNILNPFLRKNIAKKGAETSLWGGASLPKVFGAGATLAPFAMQAMGKWDKGPEEFTRMGGKFDFDYDQMRQDIAEAVAEGDYENFKAVLAKYDLTEGQQVGFWDTLAHGQAEGGRAMAQGGRIGLRHAGDLGAETMRRYFRNPPLTQYEKEMVRMSPEEKESDLKRFRRLLKSKSRREKRDLLHWDDEYTMGHRAMEYGDDPTFEEFYEKGEHYNKGGRVAAQEGGLMNLGGMEKDYRNDGGFVPIGGEEKADDVPARLSRNEFVFTADAVRNAGGGDMDAGAEVMENVMKNLEQGGKISEESQGQGAQGMFDVSERLSEVV